jgi:hypothetical protein
MKRRTSSTETVGLEPFPVDTLTVSGEPHMALRTVASRSRLPKRLGIGPISLLWFLGVVRKKADGDRLLDLVRVRSGSALGSPGLITLDDDGIGRR